jgi:hypothetical protein
VKHNLDNSLDVEYVRNVISIQPGTNAAAKAAIETAMWSLERSPGLLNQTFRELREVLIEGEVADAFPFDLGRVKGVLSAVCRALAYRDFGRDYQGDWRVFCASLGSEELSPEWEAFRRMLAALAFTSATVPQPDVFTYGTQTRDAAFVYRLVFYGAFVAFAWPVSNRPGPAPNPLASDGAWCDRERRE